MEIVEKNKVTVYRYDGQYGTIYSIGVSNKKQDGSYENGYLQARFKKGVELENKTEIYITNAFPKWKIENKKANIQYIFINEFKTIDEQIAPTKKTLEEKEDISKIYEDFGNEIEINSEELPF